MNPYQPLIHPMFEPTLDLVRKLSAGILKRDPYAPLISRIAREHRQKQKPILDKYIKPNISGKKFIHFVSGQTITVVNRNICGKLIIKWPDGNMSVISDKELATSFSEKQS